MNARGVWGAWAIVCLALASAACSGTTGMWDEASDPLPEGVNACSSTDGGQPFWGVDNCAREWKP